MDSESMSYHESAFSHKSTSLRAVVGLTSALSVVGSLLIILSYVCFKDLRTKAREILMHISLMDLGVGASNLVGVGVNFNQYYKESCSDVPVVHYYHHENSSDLCNVHTVIGGLCKVQGGLAILFTIGSVLWTICLSMFLYLLVSRKDTKEAKIFVRFAYFFCYLMPVGLTLWLGFTGRIGYSLYESTGWCGTVFTRGPPDNRETDIIGATFGYNLWILLTFILVPVLSISAHMFIRDEVNTAGRRAHSERILIVLQRLDYKFLLVPVAFILLRMWSFLGDIWFVYSDGSRITPESLARALMYLEGVGDSGQGIVNAVLFVLFTKKVRERFICCWRHCSCYRKRAFLFDKDEETRKLLEANRKRLNSGSYTAITPSLSPRTSPDQGMN